MRKVLTALVAGGLLVGAAFAASVVSSNDEATAQETTEDATPELQRPRRGALLSEVLDELVADGVITSEQAEAITAALAAKVEEFKAEHPDAGHPFRRGARFGFRMGRLLEDGVISADEIAELPDGHPMKDPDGPAADYLDDGELTLEELRQLREELKEQRQAAPQSGGDTPA